MTTKRDQLYRKLIDFYAEHDPSRTAVSLEPLVNFGLAEGLAALNRNLVKRYGQGINLNDDQSSGNVLDVDKDNLRHSVELFYFKHDPSKLQTPEDMEAVVEFGSMFGLSALDKRLKDKYGEVLKDATREDAVEQLKKYYVKINVAKKEKDLMALLEWAMVHSWPALSKRLAGRYGTGLDGVDSQSLEKSLRKKLETFFRTHDPNRLNDEANLKFMTTQAMKMGLERFNAWLQRKYGANFNTVPKVAPKPVVPVAAPPPFPKPQPKSVKEEEKPVEEESEVAEEEPVRMPAESISEESFNSDQEADSEDQEQVLKDTQRLEDLEQYTKFFFLKHDHKRIYKGVVSEVTEQLTTKGEAFVDNNLREEYGEGLAEIEQQYLDIEERLVLFYRIYDEERLEKPIDTIIGWTIYQGEDKLNESLMNRYDEDLAGTGLKKRLRIFYASVGEERSEEELAQIANFTLRKGLGKLNKRMKKKYGKCLEDMYLNEDFYEDEESSGLTGEDNLSEGSEGLVKHGSYGSYAERSQKPRKTSRLMQSFKASMPMIEIPEQSFEDERKKTGLLDNDDEDFRNVYPKPLPRLETLNVVPVETVRQTQMKSRRDDDHEDLRSRVAKSYEESEEEANDYRKANKHRKSLKMINRRRGSMTPMVKVPSEGQMMSKLARFLKNIDESQAVKQQQAQKTTKQYSQPKENRSGSFSYKMERNGTAIAENLREVDIGASGSMVEDRIKRLEAATKEDEESEPERERSGSVFLRKSKQNEKKAAAKLVHRLRMFYMTHDPSKATKGKVIRGNVEFVLQNGIGALNKKLMEKYGESLNSVDLSERKESMRNLKKQKGKNKKKPKGMMKAMRSSRNVAIPQAQAERLKNFL